MPHIAAVLRLFIKKLAKGLMGLGATEAKLTKAIKDLFGVYKAVSDRPIVSNVEQKIWVPCVDLLLRGVGFWGDFVIWRGLFFAFDLFETKDHALWVGVFVVCGGDAVESEGKGSKKVLF